MRDNAARSAGRVGLDLNKDLTAAEERLIDLLREGLGDEVGFTIVVRKQADGRFFVSQSDPRQSVVPGVGSGETFEEAWQAAGTFSEAPMARNTLALALDSAMSRALDAWIAGQPAPEPTRGEAASRAIREWLVGLGLLARRPYPDNIH